MASMQTEIPLNDLLNNLHFMPILIVTFRLEYIIYIYNVCNMYNTYIDEEETQQQQN